MRDVQLMLAALDDMEAETPTIVAGDLNAVRWERTFRRAMRILPVTWNRPWAMTVGVHHSNSREADMRILTSLAALSVAFAGSAAAQVTAPDTDIVLVAPEVEVEGYQPYDYEADANLEDTLDDADVYSSITSEDIGEVDDVHAGATADDTFLELEIGGFLDIGDKDIAVPLDQVSIYRGADDDYRVYIEATEEQLEDYPEFDD
jgi:hypothetical protein